MENLTPFKKIDKDSLKEGIFIVGAQEHNLKNINVFIPRNKITVITGLSGSGKSSLAFDTIYGEGQRRYMETLSTYARYFIDQMKRPKVDAIYGLSPSIAIHQKTISFNPRSTVGTTTEIYDYIRLLYARLGDVLCPEHQLPLKEQTAKEILSDVMKFSENKEIIILSPLARGKKGEFVKEFEHCLSLGLDRARIDGKWKDLGSVPKLEKRKDHYIDVLIDRLPIETKFQKRILSSIEKALSLSQGYIRIEQGTSLEKFYSIHFSCPQCDYSFPELEPKLFSFNSPKGSCTTCNGTGLSYFEEDVQEEEEEDVSSEICENCKGARLKPSSLQVKIKDLNISELSQLSVDEIYDFIKTLKFTGTKDLIAQKIIKPILLNISFLKELGSGYLSLDRSLSTLSGGEAQRIRLISQLSSPLIGVLYVLDEPSIGLHSRDHKKILNVLKTIRDRGNTVIIVEHDEESICSADQIIDIGLGAGIHGGEVIAQGSLADIKSNKKSLTGAYLSRREKIPFLKSSYTGKESVLEMRGVRANNLKNINVKIPLGRFVGISGISGSGKSSLVSEALYPALTHHLNKEKMPNPPYDSVKGLESVYRVIQIDQKPIGRTPRSIPVTYIGVFQMIRALFSHIPEARQRGYTPGHFSFNISGGRCENCKGAGSVKLEMRFLSNVFTPCEICQEKRYQRDILSIKYRGKNISDILNMTVEEASEFFKNHSLINHKLNFLKSVGLGYITLGQSSTTLSGGEAQRIKLSRELAKKVTNHTVYILDEPTTGLHFHDIRRLIILLRQLSQKGHTVLVIEHNLDVLKSCDYLIDLGPEGGHQGGEIIAQGTPEDFIGKFKTSTALYLKKLLQKIK